MECREARRAPAGRSAADRLGHLVQPAPVARPRAGELRRDRVHGHIDTDEGGAALRRLGEHRLLHRAVGTAGVQLAVRRVGRAPRPVLPRRRRRAACQGRSAASVPRPDPEAKADRAQVVVTGPGRRPPRGYDWPPPMLSLYRRHRPRTFEQVVGQESVVRTLRNAIELGKVHHAYLFVGSRGTGKTSMAKLLACALNAEGGPRTDFSPDDPACQAIMDGNVAGRGGDGRRVEQLGRRHPRAARERGARADGRRPARLHPRRGAHALARGLERVPEDAGGAAAATWSSCWPPPRRTRCRPRSSTAATASTSSARRWSRSPSVLQRVAAEESIALPDPAVGMIARKAGGQLPRRARHARAARDLRRQRGGARGRAGQPRRGRRRPDPRQRRSPDREVPEGRAAHRRTGWPTPGATTSSSCATSPRTCASCWWSRPSARCRTPSPSPPSTPTGWPRRRSGSRRATCCGRSTCSRRRSPRCGRAPSRGCAWRWRC